MKLKIIICFLLFLIVPLFLISFGCGSSTTTTSTTTTLLTGNRDYYPNRDGNSWAYRKVTTMNTTTDVTTINSVLTFNGVATIDSITVQKLKIESFSGTYSSTRDAYQTVSDSYVKNYGDQYHPTTEADTYLVFPLTIGAGWTISGTKTATVAAVESVTVPAGSYSSCFRVHMIFPPNATTDIWLAKNVGMVKSEAISINGTDSTITTTELTGINF